MQTDIRKATSKKTWRDYSTFSEYILGFLVPRRVRNGIRVQPMWAMATQNCWEEMRKMVLQEVCCLSNCGNQGKSIKIFPCLHLESIFIKREQNNFQLRIGNTNGTRPLSPWEKRWMSNGAPQDGCDAIVGVIQYNYENGHPFWCLLIKRLSSSANLLY